MSTRAIQEALELLPEGRLADAIPNLVEVTRRMPAYAAAHILLARAYESDDRWEEARRAWEHAYFLVPNSPVVREGLRRSREALRSDVASGFDDVPLLDVDAEPEPEPVAEAPVHVEASPGQDPVVTALPADDVAEDPPPEPAELDVDAFELPEPGEDAGDRLAEGEDEAVLLTEDEEEPDVAGDRAATAEQAHDLDAHPEGEAGDADAAEVDTVKVSNPVEEENPAARPFGLADDDDLDRLIHELESARIVPRPDLEDVPAPELDDDVDDMVSETLARIYASQGQYGEAARVYEQLAVQQPDQAERFRRLAAEMRDQSGDT